MLKKQVAGVREHIVLEVGGAGFVGSEVTDTLAISRQFKTVYSIDLAAGKQEGQRRDTSQAARIQEVGQPLNTTEVVAITDYAQAKGVTIAIITAGLPRKAGQSRLDLFPINAKIVKGIIKELEEKHPDGNIIYIVVTNPVGHIVNYIQDELDIPKHRIMGQAGVLDTSRYVDFTLDELTKAGYPRHDILDIDAPVLGEHGDLMVSTSQVATVTFKAGTTLPHDVDNKDGFEVKGNTPLKEDTTFLLRDLLRQETIASIEERTKKGGAQFAQENDLGRSASRAPGKGAAQMAIQIAKGGGTLPAIVKCEGEYNIDGTAGVLVKLGPNGVDDVVQREFPEDIVTRLQDSARKVAEDVTSRRQEVG